MTLQLLDRSKVLTPIRRILRLNNYCIICIKVSQLLMQLATCGETKKQQYILTLGYLPKPLVFMPDTDT